MKRISRNHVRDESRHPVKWLNEMRVFVMLLHTTSMNSINQNQKYVKYTNFLAENNLNYNISNLTLKTKHATINLVLSFTELHMM